LRRLETFEGTRKWREFTSRSPGETLELGNRIGALLPEGSVVSLEGGLGAGKTLLAKGICSGLGVSDEVISPSFVLLEEYLGVLPVLHFDLYRLQHLQEVIDLGLFDAIDGKNIIIVEWGDRLPEGELRADIRVTMRISGGEEREISIEAPAGFLEAVQGG
jgi:tRNA threonylcarbamoyladenosine biosynthesis protein TsaE